MSSLRSRRQDPSPSAEGQNENLQTGHGFSTCESSQLVMVQALLKQNEIETAAPLAQAIAEAIAKAKTEAKTEAIAEAKAEVAAELKKAKADVKRAKAEVAAKLKQAEAAKPAESEPKKTDLDGYCAVELRDLILSKERIKWLKKNPKPSKGTLCSGGTCIDNSQFMQDVTGLNTFELIELHFDLESEFRQVADSNKNMFTFNCYEQPVDIHEESDLTIFFKLNLLTPFFRPMNVGVSSGGFIGKLDVALQFQNRIFTILELKNEWSFNPNKESVIEVFNSCVKRSNRKEAEIGCTHCICNGFRQIYSYMNTNNVKYGFLTTYYQTYICGLRDPGLQDMQPLFVSRALEKKELLRALYLVFHWNQSNIGPIDFEATVAPQPPQNGRDEPDNQQDDSEHDGADNQDGSRSNQRRPKPSKRSTRTDYDLRDIKSREKTSTINMCLGMKLIHPLRELGEGRTGSVYEGIFYQAQRNLHVKAAYKMADVSKQPHLLKELQNEATIYTNHLSGLKCVPRLLYSGYIAPVIFCNVWQMIDGKSIEFSQMSCQQRRQVTERVKSLHRNGVCHGDIRPANFIFANANNKCFIIDFGFSYETKDLSDFEAEMEVLNDDLNDSYE